MGKRIFLLLLVVSLTTGTSYAYFSDTATSTGNTATAGTLKFGSPQSMDFNVTNAAPGDTFTGDKNPYDIGNKGTIAADHVEIEVANTVTDTGDNADPDIDRMLIVDKLLYGSLNVKSLIEGNTGATSVTSDGYKVSLEDGSTFSTILSDSAITLDTWESKVIEIADDPGTAGTATGLGGGDTANFDIDLKFNAGAGNEYQEDSVGTIFTFTLNQDASQ